jgi:membrane protein implicated in regulation of membrane protease activity
MISESSPSGEDSSATVSAGTDFTAVGKAAEAAAADPAIANPEPSPEVPKSARTQDYKDEVVEDMKVHRSMRRWAFFVMGGLVVCYLVALLAVLLISFFHNKFLLAALVVPNANWHVLVLIGIAIIVFAAIPLTLAMALVKMISSSHEDAEAQITLPNAQLVTLLIDALKHAFGGRG